MHELAKDVRYAVRMMLKTPGVTAIAMASLAVGLAANITIFTLVNAIFFRPLAVEKPEGLVSLFGTDAKLNQNGGGDGNFLPISRPNFEDYRDRSQVFSGLSNLSMFGANMARQGAEPEQVGIHMVSANFFAVMGLRPAAGRFFLAEEDEVPGRNPVAVLAYRTFRERFGSDPAVLGSTVTLNAHPFTVVGVAPEGFEGPMVLGAPALWVPIMSYELVLPSNLAQHYKSRRAMMTFAIGRLKPGVTIGEAEASLQTIGKSLESEFPEENTGRNVGLMPLNQARVPPQMRRNFVMAGGLLMAVVALVLLIACANVANLLLNRALARRTEIAVRLSIGAGRQRLIRQLLVESLVLGVSAMLAGLALATWARGLLWAFRPPFLDQAQLDLSFDLRVLTFTVVVSLLTSLLFGLVPALQATRPEVVSSLKLGSGMASGRPRLFSLRNLLVAAQVALSLVALIVSGLFLRSMGNATHTDLGMDAAKVGVVPLNATAAGYDPMRAAQLFDTVLERVRALPGVESVALGTNVPMLQGGFARTVFIEGRDPKAPNNAILTQVNPVGEGYFKTLGIPMLQGRDFTPQDRPDSTYAAIFNEAAVRRFFAGEPALGQRFRFFQEKYVVEVVAVVKDSKIGAVGEEPQAMIYLPRWQHPAAMQNLFVRASSNPQAVLAQARDQVRSIDSNLPLANVLVLSDGVRQTLWPARMAAGLLGLFGGLALALAMAGIYGVMSYSVAQRRREIGIRMALGAPGEAVVGLLVKRGMILVAAGLAVGIGLALAASRGIQGMLYGMSASDPPTFGVTTTALALVAFLATLLPARRATMVDPVTVLKSEGR